MPSIYLLRHGDYDNPLQITPGRLPLALSKSGKEQAAKLHDYFADKKIGHMYSSAVLRCKQTAEITSGGIIPITYDQRLLETMSAYQGYWGENKYEGGYHFLSHVNELGGEDFTGIQRRMADFWDEIAPHLTENIITCSHGDPLQLLYSYIEKLEAPDESTSEDEIKGWLGRGEFMEVIVEDGKVKEIKTPVRL